MSTINVTGYSQPDLVDIEERSPPVRLPPLTLSLTVTLARSDHSQPLPPVVEVGAESDTSCAWSSGQADGAQFPR